MDFSNFTTNNPDPSPSKQMDFSSFRVNTPNPRTMFQQTGAFKGKESIFGDQLRSQYDTGLVFGQDQYQVRADNQSHLDRVVNSIVKTTPAVGLGILENAGYLGELASYIFNPDAVKDYSNKLVEWSIEKRGKLDEELPNYLRDRELHGIKTLTDASWWIQHGQGLFESIGEFLVTGATVGGGLGKGAKALNSIIGSSGLKAGVTSAAQLGTASTLAYTEGAMSGARIFNDVYNAEIAKGVPDYIAKEFAGKAASKTVALNTVLNTGLNLSSVAPLFKTLNNIESGVKSSVKKEVGETLANYATRLETLAANGVKKESVKAVLVREALQEGLEEDVNLFAEGEGYIEGGLKQKKGDSLDRFLTSTFSSEGALNFILGAIGGVGQTAGMNYVPYRKYTSKETGTTERVSNATLNNKMENEELRNTVANLHEDIKYLTTKQKDLSRAVAAGDKTAVEKARHELYNVAALKSIRNGTAEEFQQELAGIAAIDNVKIGEDGMTDAMRLGYADSTQDNEYKTTALKKASEIKPLQQEYQDLVEKFKDPFVADQAFRLRADLYSHDNYTEGLKQRVSGFETNMLNITTDKDKFQHLKEVAELKAIDKVLPSIQNKKALALVEARKKELTKILDERKDLEIGNSYSKAVADNEAVVSNLTLAYVPLTVATSESALLRNEYQNVLGKGAKQFEEGQLQLKSKIMRKAEEALQAKKVKKDAEKQEEENAVASEKTKATKEQLQKEKPKSKKKVEPSTEPVKKSTKAERTKYNNYYITTTKDGQYRVEDADGIPQETVATKEEAKALIDKKGGKSVAETQTEKKASPFVFTGKTKEDKEAETKALLKDVEANALADTDIQGNHNKIEYKAQEQGADGKTVDFNTINEDYLELHSSSFNVGTEVTLKLAKESEFYDEKDSPEKIAIGIYHKGKLVGYVSKAYGVGKLLDTRKAVIGLGEVATKIVAKDMGVVNNVPERYAVRDAMPDVTEFAIGRNGVFETAPGVSISGLANTSIPRDGFVYAIVKTPNGRKLAIPVDIKKINDEVIESIQLAVNIFINHESLSEQEIKLVDDIAQIYGIDLTTSAGLRNYVSSFIYIDSELQDSKRIASINKEVGKENHYFNVTGTGIQFIKSGAARKSGKKLIAQELGRNTPKELLEGVLDELGNQLRAGAYTKIDLLKLRDNDEFRLPLLKLDDEGNLKTYSLVRETFVDYLKENTTTNVKGIKINENEYTYFVQPRIYFDTSFTNIDQKTLESVESAEKTAILAPNRKVAKLGSVTKGLNKTKVDPTKVTNKDVEDRKKYCL